MNGSRTPLTLTGVPASKASSSVAGVSGVALRSRVTR